MELNFKKIPTKPGCYLYSDKGGKIIYVGKAKNLKKRVSSYFNKKNLDSKTEALVKNISKIDFIVTNNELEAFLLENNLIKKNSPKYNINLKDSKSYAYIELTNEKFPGLIISREKRNLNERDIKNLFGPFVSASSRNQALDILVKTFGIRTCKKLPNKKCIRYDLGICSAPCINNISQKEYLSDVENATLALKGKNKELVLSLSKKMKESSKNQEYEKALKLKNQISSIEYLKEKQTMDRNKEYNEDIINYLISGENIYFVVFNIYKGTLENKRTFELRKEEDFFENFLSKYYAIEKIPKKIIVPKEVSKALNDFINNLKNSKVEIILPKKGELKSLLDLAKKNLEIHYLGDLEKLKELKKVLNLEEIPEIIECFDISHLGGTQVVASMVQFRNGVADKSNYRKFKIKSFEGNDDFRAMKEVVKRRYFRLKKENLEFPNLIIIDGGKGQLSSAMESLKELNLKIPIISLAKKFEEIFVPYKDDSIKLGNKDKSRLFLQSIRDEAHRFAIKFQRESRSKKIFNPDV